MELTRDFMLDRFNARDASYNGRFLTGVFSTGIYCLPSCTARKPKPENVGFFQSAEAARAAGLRACRRCRPDDFLRGYDPNLELADEIGRVLQQNPEQFSTAASVAERWGLSATRWNEFAQRHFHRRPADLLNHWRVQRAQELLLNSDLRVLDIAGEAGFESTSAFNEQFRKRSALRPSDFRELRHRDEFTLALPNDYPRDFVLGFLGRDPQSPTERVEGSTIWRALEWNGRTSTLEIVLDRAQARCRLLTARQDDSADSSASGAPDAPEHRVHAYRSAFRQLGLGSDPIAFQRHLERLAARGIRLPVDNPALRIPQTPTLFEGLVWSIVGQQVNLAFAYTLRRRLIEFFDLACPGGLLAHPDPQRVADLDPQELTSRQYSGRKAEYLVGVARSLVDGSLDGTELLRLPATRVESRLLAQRGLGPWSTHYVMMRALAFADCVPVGDTGLATALQRHFELDQRPHGEEVQRLLAPFAPYRSLATTHLWHSLGAIA